MEKITLEQYRRLPFMRGYFTKGEKPTREQFENAMRHRAYLIARRRKDTGWLDRVLALLEKQRVEKRAKDRARRLRQKEEELAEEHEEFSKLEPGMRICLRRRRNGPQEYGVLRIVHGFHDLTWDRVKMRPSKRKEGVMRPAWKRSFAAQGERVDLIYIVFNLS